jgi:hypothetical protein
MEHTLLKLKKLARIVVKLQAQTPILDGTAISVNRINN